MQCKFCNWKKHYRKIYENDHVVAVWGSPYVRGHIKVILKKHYADLTEVPSEELHSLIDVWKIVGKAVEEVIHPDIINWQINGNWVRHVHGHIYPRWETDHDWGEPLKLPTKEQDRNKEYFPKELGPEDRQKIEDLVFHRN